MAVRVSHINDMMASRIDRDRRNPLATRDLSIAQLGAIFAGAGTERALVAVEFLDDDGEAISTCEVGSQNADAIRVNGLDFLNGHARPVFA